MHRPARTLLVLAALAALSGCATPVRSRALALASTGASAARTAGDSLLETRSAVDRYLESQHLLGPLTGLPAPSGDTLASLGGVKKALGARAEVMRSLGDAYLALEALAAFDAGGAVEKGVHGLAGAVTEYRAALGQPPVSASPAFTLGKGAGLLAGARQAARLKAASGAIRESLEKAVELLRREREVHASVRRVLVEARGATARALASLGLGRPGPLLAPHAAAFGLVFDEKEYDGALALLRKEPSATGAPGKTRADDLRLALDRVLELRVARQAELEGALVDETLAGLESLVVAHTAFEAKAEPDVAAVTGHVAAVRALLDEYRKASGN